MIEMPKQANVVAKSPVGNVRLYAGVPWDNAYRHVRKYNTGIELYNFLQTKLVHVMENTSPVMPGKMKVRMNVNEFTALGANYLSFLNPTFDNVTHYAFITGSEPLSDNSTMVYYELDIWNENQFSLKLNPCFVERMIVPKSEDVVGAFTYPEGLEMGEIKEHKITTLPIPGERSNVRYVFFTTFDPATLEIAEGEIYQGVYSGVGVSVAMDVDGANSFVKVITEKGKADGLINVVQMYDEFSGKNMSWRKFEFSSVFKTIDGYAPKNNKLFTYPYNFLTLNSNQGAVVELRHEDFSGNTKEIEYSVAINGGYPVLFAYPKNYLGVEKNVDYAVQFTGFPQCAISTDFYKAWLAQNATAQNLKMAKAGIMGVGGMIAGGATAGIGASIAGATATTAGATIASPIALSAIAGTAVAGIGMIKDIGGQVLDFMAQKTVAQIQPPDARTTAGNGVNCQMNTEYITLSNRYIKAEYAKQIDDYFSMFGYHIGRIRQPDITSRPAWNYVKTKNCSISGNIEHNDLQILREIFDKGVTVWHNNDVGNYGLEN